MAKTNRTTRQTARASVTKNTDRRDITALRKPAAKGDTKRGWTPWINGRRTWQGPGRPPGTSPEAIERRVLRDTCGLGNWRQPEGWDRTAYSHTVTAVDDVNAGFDSGWHIYNSGVVVALVVHDHASETYMRGQPYVWCKPTRNGCGSDGAFPTACIFGRFVEKDRRGRAVALVGKGKRQTIDAAHSLCFRAVGHVNQGDQFYPRSEVPVPIPSEAVRHDAPMQFDCLQAAVKAMDTALEAMANVTEMVDELNDATSNAKDAYLDRRCREAAAYCSLDELLTTAMHKQGTLSKTLAAFHEASPELAHWLKRWQASPQTGA